MEAQMLRLGSRTLLLLLFLCYQPTIRADVGAIVGTPAPELTLRELLQAPQGTRATWHELKGQAVVLEFWATWCGGCVDNIPHLNELAEQFKSKSIQFISITDETDIDAVKRFLEHHPMSGWIAFDAEESTFKRYGIEGRPRTLLINQNGVVQAITNPLSVTPQVLDDLLADKPLNFPESRMGPLLGLEPGAPMPLLQILIRPAAPVAVSGTSPGGVMDKNGRFDVYGETLREILSEVYQIPANRIDAPEWCGSTRYDVSVVTPQHEEALRMPLLKESLDATFQMKLHEEMKQTPVYILKKLDGQQPKMRIATKESRSGYWNPRKGEVERMGSSIGIIAKLAQLVLGKETLDETGLSDHYDFQLKWDSTQPSSLVEAVRNQLGLELTTEERKLVHLVVDSAKEPKTW